MKKLIILTLPLLIILTAFQQQDGADPIKITVTAGDEIIRGASLSIKGAKPPMGTITDCNGIATLIVSKDYEIIEITPFYNYYAFKVIRPVDSIHVDLNSKRATYFLKGRKINKKRIVVN